MSDNEISEMWREHRLASQEKRESNRESSAKLLSDNNIKYISKNGGAHLVVEKNIDFWPGTGLWIIRGNKHRKYGVRSLIKHLQSNA